jgi:hypothetical protein
VLKLCGSMLTAAPMLTRNFCFNSASHRLTRPLSALICTRRLASFPSTRAGRLTLLSLVSPLVEGTVGGVTAAAGGYPALE